MVQKLSIRNFKSTRALDIDCRRVNIFIGEPNAGKTNILEVLSIFGDLRHQNTNLLLETCRASHPSELFSNNDFKLGTSVEIDRFKIDLMPGGHGYELRFTADGIHQGNGFITDKGFTGTLTASETWPTCSYYTFSNKAGEGHGTEDRLLPPFGQNLLGLLYSSRDARQLVSNFYQATGCRLHLDSNSRKILLSREIDDTLISFPYSATSETLRRMVFYSLALETNRNAILAFDEPEAHSFPPYTKTLAERIALDDRGNQFFLTTHSPYMLDSLLSKTPASDLNVALCRMENFETRAYPLNQEQIDHIKEWSMDAFFNFDRLLPEVK